VEFTRLAQLTKEPKYYDAIARITDALEEWQNHTRLPGMWPSYVDASGCERVQFKSDSLNIQTDGASTLMKLDAKGHPLEEMPAVKQPIGFSTNKGPSPPLDSKVTADEKPNRIKGWDENHPEQKDSSEKEKFVPLKKPEPIAFEAKSPEKASKVKRQFDDPELLKQLREAAPTVPEVNIPPAHVLPAAVPPKETTPECIPHGLGSQSKWGDEEFTLGSMADSTYEYLPKASINLTIESTASNLCF
jgi:mannosyl-oligosaccharide alpha-1,2-mannosidase